MTAYGQGGQLGSIRVDDRHDNNERGPRVNQERPMNGFEFQVRAIESMPGRFDVTVTKTWYNAGVQAELDIFADELMLAAKYIALAKQAAAGAPLTVEQAQAQAQTHVQARLDFGAHF